ARVATVVATEAVEELVVAVRVRGRLLGTGVVAAVAAPARRALGGEAQRRRRDAADRQRDPLLHGRRREIGIVPEFLHPLDEGAQPPVTLGRRPVLDAGLAVVE